MDSIPFGYIFLPVKSISKAFRALVRLAKHSHKMLLILLLVCAAGLGLEPRYHGPKPCVLPLDDPAKLTAVEKLSSSI